MHPIVRRFFLRSARLPHLPPARRASQKGSIMSNYIEKAQNDTFPVVAVNGTVAFPSVKINLEITEPHSIAAVQAACETNSFVLLVTAKDVIADTEITPDRLYTVGTVAKIKQTIKTPDKTLSIIVEGFSRATVTSYSFFADYMVADVICKTVSMPDEGGLRGEALIREAIAAVEKVLKFSVPSFLVCKLGLITVVSSQGGPGLNEVI